MSQKQAKYELRIKQKQLMQLKSTNSEFKDNERTWEQRITSKMSEQFYPNSPQHKASIIPSKQSKISTQTSSTDQKIDFGNLGNELKLEMVLIKTSKIITMSACLRSQYDGQKTQSTLILSTLILLCKYGFHLTNVNGQIQTSTNVELLPNVVTKASSLY